jgi:hypothetical protein
LFRAVLVFQHHVFQIPAITNFGTFGNLASALPPPPMASTMIPKELLHSTPEIHPKTGPESRQTGLNHVKSAVFLWL